MAWHVYMVVCSDQTYYCGIAKDVLTRIGEHNHGKRGAKYTRSRRPVRLVWYEHADGKLQALRREREIKKMTRRQKQAMVRKTDALPVPEEVRRKSSLILHLRADHRLPRVLDVDEVETLEACKRNQAKPNQWDTVNDLCKELAPERLTDDVKLSYDRVCFCCLKPMKPVDGDAYFDNPKDIPFLNPNNGTDWTTSGNWGSTAFDPLDDFGQLHIVVCDACLQERAKTVYYRRVRKGKTYDVVRKWDPKED